MGLDVAGVRGRPFPGYPGHGAAEVITALASSASAGPTEELLCLAVPIALAARSGWHPWATFVLVLTIRLAFHLYYGWTALFVLLWIPATWLLYRAAQTVWPLIVAHSVYDMAITVLNHTSGRLHILTEGLRQASAYLGVALAAVTLDRYRRIRRPQAPAPVAYR